MSGCEWVGVSLCRRHISQKHGKGRGVLWRHHLIGACEPRAMICLSVEGTDPLSGTSPHVTACAHEPRRPQGAARTSYSRVTRAEGTGRGLFLAGDISHTSESR